MMILVSAIYLVTAVLLVIDRTYPVLPPEIKPMIDPALAALGAALLWISVRIKTEQSQKEAAIPAKIDKMATGSIRPAVGGALGSPAAELAALRHDLEEIRRLVNDSNVRH
jgi:hypothetical protein